MAALLGGCAVNAGEDAAPGWEEPGWMAQVRQQDEEHQNATLSCYAEYGIEAERSVGGGRVLIVGPTDDEGNFAPGHDAIHEAAGKDCAERVPLQDNWVTRQVDEPAYLRMLELRDCIIAHGHHVAEPPSFESWKDSDPMQAWNPYEAMLTNPSQVGIPRDELPSLMEACPQPGPSFFVEAQ